MTATGASASGEPREDLVPRASSARAWLLLVGVAGVAVGVVVGGGAAGAATVAGIAVLGGVALGSRLLDWRVLLIAFLAVVFMVPARRVVLAVNVPFDPEPYRLVAVALLLVWAIALLIDPAVRLRKTPFDWPICAFAVVVIVSDLANPRLVNAYGQNVVKTLVATFLVIGLFYFATSVLFTREHAEFLVRIIVLASSLVAFAAIVESATRFNVFDEAARGPGLQYAPQGLGIVVPRGGRERVLASAEHPLALGALFALVFPLSVYLVSRSLKWIVTSGLLLVGVFVTISRAPILMLIVAMLIFGRLRPRQIVSLLPLLPIAACVVYFAIPNIVEPAIRSFYPKGGLVHQQSLERAQAGATGNSRLADLAPALKDFANYPVTGSGAGTRPFTYGAFEYYPDGRYAEPLDNQWLASLLAIGLFGVAALVWLLLRAYRRLAQEARQRASHDGWLAASLAASVASFPVAMVFFDVFSFIQTTIVFYFVLAVAAVFLRSLPAVREVALGPDVDPAWSRSRMSAQLRRIGQYTASRPDAAT